MTKLLYLNSSPRGEDAASVQAADHFLSALPNGTSVDQINLFEANLPDFTAPFASAKQKTMMGMPLDETETRQWAEVTRLVDQFLAADHYLINAPMWNFSIPYKLKHYIDMVTHPGLTFSAGADGIKGMASGSATVIFSRGGDYSPKDGAPDPFDFQSPYVKAWLGLVGLGPVNEILVQGTLAGPQGQANAVAGVADELKAIAAALN